MHPRCTADAPSRTVRPYRSIPYQEPKSETSPYNCGCRRHSRPRFQRRPPRRLPENYHGASGTGASVPCNPESENVLGAYILIWRPQEEFACGAMRQTKSRRSKRLKARPPSNPASQGDPHETVVDCGGSFRLHLLYARVRPGRHGHIYSSAEHDLAARKRSGYAGRRHWNSNGGRGSLITRRQCAARLSGRCR
jgi:hypothetical protein